MNSLAKTNNLEKYNLVEERIIYDSSNHLQYAAKRMDGEAQKVSTENYAITKTFAKDAANAVLFLNSQHIVYGNYKPINFLYKKLPSGDFKFFLQDYGLLSKLENGKMSDGYRINSLCNESLYKSIINEKNEYREQIELPNQISNEQFVKIRNLSGLIFTTLAFHHKVETSGFTNVYNQYNDKYQFRGFCEAIGIKEKSDADLLFKLCYGKKMLSITQLEQVESILRKTFDLKKI